MHFRFINGLILLKSALDCAVKQSVKCRILLVDNNSPHDEFKKIIDGYNNPLIKYVKTDHTVPQDENFNNCFRYAETPWLTILHDDDLLHFQFVELAEKILDKYGDKIGGFAVKNFVSEKEWEDTYKKVTFTDDIKLVKAPFFYFAQLSPFPGVVLHRETALKIGGFEADLHPIADFDFWYRYSVTKPMLYVDQYLAYYRISPLQSTNHLIDAMINNVYEYRMREIRKSRYNNFFTRLALEQSRINNIKFFKETYPNIEMPEKLVNETGLRKAEKLLKIKLLSKYTGYYKRKISFDSVNKL